MSRVSALGGKPERVTQLREGELSHRWPRILPDGSALLLTVAKFQGPDGKKIQDEAVAPTVLVGQSAQDDVDADENPGPNKGDEPLNKALELLKSKNS